MYSPILYIILFIQHIIQYILCLTLYISAAELSFLPSAEAAGAELLNDCLVPKLSELNF